MKKVATILSVVLMSGMVMITGCNDDSSSDIPVGLVGSYVGTFFGSDFGNWSFSVDSGGKLTGTAHSTMENADYEIKGTVKDDGRIDAGLYEGGYKGSYDGNIADNGTVSGTWASDDGTEAGTYSGFKEN